VDLDGLEAFEFVEGVAVVALSGVDDALETAEDIAGRATGAAQFGGTGHVFQLVLPDLGFGGGEAAEGPGGADEDIDLIALLGDFRLDALVVFLGEGVELEAILAGDDERLGIDTGFHGVHAGTGFALGGAGARGGVWRLH
jgi:hypothetical protein